MSLVLLSYFVTWRNSHISCFTEEEKYNLSQGGREDKPTNYSLSIDCTPSKLFTYLKTFYCLTMVMFCCIFGYQRNKIFRIPTFEMLLFIDGKGSESQIAQDCRKVGMDHYLSTTTICQLLCLVPHRYKCICTFFIREMIVLNDGGLIGMSEPNL